MRPISLKNEERTEKRTETHACDLISRGQAIDAVCAVNDVYKSNPHIDAIIDALEDLPPAQPEPKEGHWIEGGIYRDIIECHCSECGQLMTTAATVRMNYCPRCGAKMKGAEHETN